MCGRAAEGRGFEQATSSQTSAKEEQQSSEAGQKEEAGRSQQLLQASAGMRHMRRKMGKGKMGKGKAPRTARKPHKSAGLMSNGDLVPREETEVRQSSLEGSMPDSTAAVPGGGAAAQPWVGRTEEGTRPGATASEVVYSTVTDSGLVMWRPGYRLSTAASCLHSTAPKVLLHHQHSTLAVWCPCCLLFQPSPLACCAQVSWSSLLFAC